MKPRRRLHDMVRIGGAAALAPLLLACAHAAALGQTTPDGFERVEIAVTGPRAATLAAFLRRPASDRPVPAIIALHGCGGLYSRRGSLAAREADWADRLAKAGYAVLLPDSFTPRGIAEICTIAGSARPIRPQHRAQDAAAAFGWLKRQAFADPARIALIGWSNGGSSVLWAAEAPGELGTAPRPVAAIAFYPGCRVPAEREGYRPAIPLSILIGAADDWTPPEPCRTLAARHGAKLIEYPGAVHGFDAPSSPRRTRTGIGLSARGDGRVEVGTDPAARAAAIDFVLAALAQAFAGAAAR